MMRFFGLGFILVTIFALTACFQDDERIEPLPVEEIDIPYSIYEYQTYFSLSNKSIVSYHHFSDWDLGFESNGTGVHIILNSARFMYAGNTFTSNFYTVQSNSAQMVFDNSSGNLDSTVLIDWINVSNPLDTVYSGNVYIIDRGKDESGNSFGFKKIVFEKLEKDAFNIHFANLDNTDEHFYKIRKDPAKNFVLFSFDNGGSIKIEEPDKELWDICFTKYSTVIPDDYGTPTDYLVRGAYLNPFKQIRVAIDTINHFYAIKPDMIDNYTYSSKLDAIGYEWKIFQNDAYRIVDYRSYLLKGVSGLDYKMRFTDFFNNEGVKGYPSFELVELVIN